MTAQPIDYLRAEAAHNAFYSNSPQVWFDQTTTSYQLRWLHAIRAAHQVRPKGLTVKHNPYAWSPERRAAASRRTKLRNKRLKKEATGE